MHASFRFLVPASGVVIGALLGLTLGEVVIVAVTGKVLNSAMLGGGVGAILGYFVGFLIERQSRR